MALDSGHIASVSDSLKTFSDDTLKEKIYKLGLLTGWRKYPDGDYGAPNFERGLVLYRLVEAIRPKTALEIGTGRGFGSFTMAMAARDCDCELQVTTLDVIPPSARQDWAIRLDGEDKVIKASREDVWSRHLEPGLTEKITQVVGNTTETLPRLKSQQSKYDLIFIDAGHDVYSVISDLSYSIQMLSDDGVILMDDFAPLDEYGIGTVLAIQHAKRMFNVVEVFQTEGLIYGGAERDKFPRAMAILAKLKPNSYSGISKARLIFWKMLDKLIWLSLRSKAFPLT